MSTSAQLVLDKFDCEGDPTSVGARWERWKRALLIYLDAANITNAVKKRANLLHFGGFELQEAYYNIPGANVTATEGVDVFLTALSKLDDYFAPKQCKVYERHVFRLMRQEANEKFDKYIIRLRQQAEKCQFRDKNENIIDQITEKCSSIDLRKKILQIGDEITLDKITMEANSLEAVSKQLEDFSASRNVNQSVNKIDFTRKPRYDNKNNNSRKGCGRCGNFRHTSYDINCPAREKNCLKCGLKGHFRQFCRTVLPLKRKLEDKQRNTDTKPKRKIKVDTKELEKKEVDNINYVFHIDEDLEFDCSVGGVKIKMLVDSGCKQNLLTEETWETMKNDKVQVFNQVPNPNVTFVAYGSNTPLNIKGSFDATIQVGSHTEKATFYVTSEGTRNLLGKITAMALGILKVGLNLEVQNIEDPEFPKFKDFQVQLPIDDSVTPVSQPYRRIPIPLEEKVGAKIEELTKKGIIEQVKGSSRWVSPIVPILKENGELRLCVDMRRANQAIVRENHPLPTMDKILPKIRGAKIFSKLDIKDAFHQIEIHPESRHITTFITSKGLFRYKRLMFGISCAPEIFQKTLERMLLGCDGIVNFIDDILVYGKDPKEHDMRLEKVMEVLRENNVMLKKEKCLLKVNKVCFLGHELSSTGVRPLKKYINTINEFRHPTTVGELQSFLGLVSYVSKWIPDFATQTEPLKEILRKVKGQGTDLQKYWGRNQQQALESLKSALINIPTLGYYNVNDRTIVIADASPVGLGAVLVQEDKDGARIIAYGHKTLTDCERRYCQTEKEALALVWAVEHFHIFLYGKKFDLITDHKPLEIIFGLKSKPCARIERWVLRLQCYDYKVVYQPGKNNIADPLSRLCKIPKVPLTAEDYYIHQVVEITRPVAVSLKEIKDHSEEDEEIQKVKDGIYTKTWAEEVKAYKLFENELCFYQNILLRGTRIVIPKKLRERVVRAAHEGHPGVVAMKARLRTKVWWPKCDKDAETFVKGCKGCTLVSAPNPPHPLKRRDLPHEPWVDVAIDLMGPLPSGDYLFVIIDYYSRYKEVKICRKITSFEIISLLKEIFCRVGNPSSITADNGKQFISEEFKVFCAERNIKLFNTVPYWPQQNGEVERQNRDILKRVKISQTENKNWKEGLQEYLVMYNSTPHSVTGKTPSELFYNRKFRDKIPMTTGIEENMYDMDTRDRDRIMKEKGKVYADRKRKAKENDLQPGDKVYVKNAVKENKTSLNYNPDTHTVERTTGGDVEIYNDATGHVFRRNIVHLKKVQGEWKVVSEDANGEDKRSDHESDSC